MVNYVIIIYDIKIDKILGSYQIKLTLDYYITFSILYYNIYIVIYNLYFRFKTIIIF